MFYLGALQGLGSNTALNNWFQNQISGNQFGNSGMGYGMTQGMAPGVAAPAAANWQNAFATGWDR